MWMTPKTNWSPEDYFNATDFNRIKNNLSHLREMAIKLYKEFDIQPLGVDKGYEDYFYADEINLMGVNLEIINKNTLKNTYITKVDYMDNGHTMTHTELNNMEGAISDLYDKLSNQSNGRRNLSFNLGKRGGI